MEARARSLDGAGQGTGNVHDRSRRSREVAGQLFRLVGAATKTPLGLVPEGNTGGSNVSPFRRLPIAAELQAIIDEARTP